MPVIEAKRVERESMEVPVSALHQGEVFLLDNQLYMSLGLDIEQMLGRMPMDNASGYQTVRDLIDSEDYMRHVERSTAVLAVLVTTGYPRAFDRVAMVKKVKNPQLTWED